MKKRRRKNDRIDEETFKNKIKDLDNICEECLKEDESVSQNLIIHGYKICSSCNISKTIFPVW